MLGKFMNNYYYGKSGKGDYNKEDLPKNRWQLFWEMLRIRFSGLVRLNLMAAVAWIPTMIVIALLFSAALSAVGAYVVVDDGAADASTAEGTAITAETEEAAPEPLSMEDFMSVFSTSLLLLIPAITITGPVSAGVAYITRNWSRDEHAFIWSDFKDAVKENWKQALLTSFITSLLPYIIYMCWTFYGQMANTNTLYVVPQMLVVSLGVVWMLTLVFIYPMMVTYRLKFSKLVKNAMMLAIARLPQTVAVRLATLVPLIIAYFLGMYVGGITMYVLLGLLLYYVLFGYSLSRFAYASYTNGVFDKYINPHIEGAVVNRGLSTEDDSDEDEDDATPTDTDSTNGTQG